MIDLSIKDVSTMTLDEIVSFKYQDLKMLLSTKEKEMLIKVLRLVNECYSQQAINFNQREKLYKFASANLYN